jgi:hypothetical protein
MRKILQVVTGTIVLAGAIPTLGFAAADPQPQSAVWISKETQLVSMAFTTHYSCDGFRDKVHAILLDLGARKEDLKVRESGCSAPDGRPSPMARVAITMSVLAPTGNAAADSAIPAQWKTVELRGNSSRYLDPGDCELVDQVRQQLLPLFTTRNLDANISCTPHQLSPTGPVLKVDVLSPTPEKDALAAK